MRKLGIGVAVGVAIAFFVRWRGGFSHAAEQVVERLPDPVTPAPERSEQVTEIRAVDAEDATLADRVRSQVFRDERFKGNVNVHAEHGRIVLHGQLEQPGLIEELVDAVRNVDGVRGVESRLRTPEIPVELPKRPA
jgi:osmotically-inducible protein OsmY